MRAEHIGVIANKGKAGARELVRELRREFGRHPVRVSFEKDTAELANLADGRAVQELAKECDMLLVLGGDGTMLQVVQGIEGRIPPVFGINTGSLGFLTCVAGADYLQAVEYIVSGRYTLSERTMLSVDILRKDRVIASDRALNDAVISRGKLSRLIKLQVRINGDALTEYNADGLIVSTPTGSTAYSLSAGGPVLTPDSGVFIITPICPHVLTNRSVILGDDETLEISPAPDQGAVFLTMDGLNVAPVESTDRIRISKSAFELPLAMPPGVTFFDVLRQKLKWSGTAV